MSGSNVAFRVLAVVIITLIGLLVAVVTMLLSCHDGDRWTNSIRQGAAGFGGTVTAMSILYGIAIVTL